MQAKFKAAIRQFAITAVLALGIAVCIPIFVHRRDYDAAVMNWVRNPTPENQRVLRAETRKSRWDALWTQVEVGGLLFLVFNGVWFVIRLYERQS